MSKKTIVLLSVLLGIVTVVLILFWTLFALSSVTVQYSSSKINLQISDQQIVDAGEFRFGSCVLFESKKKSVEKINNFAKSDPNFAYLRVLNIETVFPNKFVIHVAEREQLFALPFEDGQAQKFLICDRDLRVLEIDETFNSTQDNAILLSGVTVENESVEIGDFLEVKEKGIFDFFPAMLQNNRSYLQQVGKIKQMQLSSIEDFGVSYPALSILTHNERKFLIENIDFALPQKLQLMFAAESAFFGHSKFDEQGNFLDENDEKIMLSKTEDNEFVMDEEGQIALSIDLLSRCLIKVGNLTLDQNIDRTEQDIYFCLKEIA